MRGVQRADLGKEIIAGVTLAAVAIPLSIGYAQIAGLPPVVGRYTAILPMLVFALFRARAGRLIAGLTVEILTSQVKKILGVHTSAERFFRNGGRSSPSSPRHTCGASSSRPCWRPSHRSQIPSAVRTRFPGRQGGHLGVAVARWTHHPWGAGDRSADAPRMQNRRYADVTMSVVIRSHLP
ncbi:SulP family inorganic anion transporter [Nonomuraea diastatica]|uniref:SulP family inorganic anion transporter n=1 Tax=Nonomuraea diastatica TaxID=1848329 RepID=A0A4R4WV80_9ACTN|nr:SulP family inorganic anion transporter [Nonomuraea diastatica]